MLEPLFYGDTSDNLVALAEAVAKTHPDWLVKLAVYCRETLHMRSVSHVLAAICAREPGCRTALRLALPRIVLRPDDLVEITALLSANGGLPRVVRPFAAEYVATLGEYPLIKYRRSGGMGLRHLARIYHPKAKDARQSLLLAYLDDARAYRSWTEEERACLPLISEYERLKASRQVPPTLSVPWELAVPLLGPHRRVWKAVLPNMPLMALLRNLGNLERAHLLGNPHVRDMVCLKLSDPEAVRASRVLPFRWLSAFRKVGGLAPDLDQALEAGLNASLANLPHWPGTTCVAIDLSGSMTGGSVSADSRLTPADIASTLGACASSLCERAVVCAFGSDCRILDLPEEGLMQRAERIRSVDVGLSTEAHLIPSTLEKAGERVDRLVVLTDCEFSVGGSLHDETARYAEQLSPRLSVFVVNLQPYGHFPFPASESRYHEISGWSEGILAYVATMEDENGLVELIDALVLGPNETRGGTSAS